MSREDVEPLPLVLKLLYERHLGEESRLRTYVASLPRRFSAPVSWTDPELAELQYPSVIFKVRLVVKLSPKAGSVGVRVMVTVKVSDRLGSGSWLSAPARATTAMMSRA